MLETERKVRRAHGIVVALVAIVTGTVAILWSWNTFAVDIIGLTLIGFCHAVALEILILAFSAPVSLPRLIRRNAVG